MDVQQITKSLTGILKINNLKTNRREFRIAHSNAMRTLRRYRLMLTSWREALVEIFQTHFGGE